MNFFFDFVLFCFLLFIIIIIIIFLIIQSQAAFVNCLYVVRFTIVHSKTKIKFPLLLLKTLKLNQFLQDIRGEELNRGAKAPEARLDIVARGSWERQRSGV